MNKLTICFLIIILFPIIPYLYVQIGSCFDQLQTKHQFTVYRDDEGIPKVVAKDKLSLFYGIGYAQA